MEHIPMLIVIGLFTLVTAFMAVQLWDQYKDI